MIDEHLQEEAALYASGAMAPREREGFELLLHFNSGAANPRERAAGNGGDDAARRAGGEPRPLAWPEGANPGGNRGRAQQTQHEAIVMAGPGRAGGVGEPAFTAMCGYSLAELRGKKLGPILQGELTERDVAARMREAGAGGAAVRGDADQLPQGWLPLPRGHRDHADLQGRRRAALLRGSRAGSVRRIAALAIAELQSCTGLRQGGALLHP